MALAACLSAAVPARAAEDEPEDAEGHIDVVQVQGMIDPVVAGLITGSVARAERSGASLVILQVDSPGALDVDPASVVRAVDQSAVPVAVWIGPAKAQAGGAAAALALAADVVAVSPGAQVGPLHPMRLDQPSTRYSLPSITADIPERLRGQAAVDRGLAGFPAPTLGDLIVGLDGRTVEMPGGPVELSTARVIQTKEGPRQTASQPVRFVKLSTLAGVQHSLTSPAVAYLLLVVGLALIIFEFFTAGIGLATLTGCASLAGAFFGFSHLPVQWWAVALVLLSAFGFAVDVQAGHLGFWTGVGVLGLLGGSLGLFGGSSLLDVPLWLVALLVVGQTVFMLGIMTVAVRNRFSVPTVGRDSMIGESGEAHTALDPDGVVLVHGAPWKARTRRGRPIAAGGAVRVVAVDQLVLEVEAAEAAGTP